MKIAFLIFVAGISLATSNVLDGSVFTKQSLYMYTADYEVIGAYVIPNADKSDGKIYTIQYDVKSDIEKGIYETTIKDNTTAKILDKGKDICYDDGTTLYVASNDGIYVYKTEDNSFKKYGQFKADIISITKLNGSDVFYAVTKDNRVFKITENGDKFLLDDTLRNVKQVMFDSSGVLHYVTKNNEVYKINGEVQKIEFGVEINNAVLLKPEIDTEALPVIINNDVFSISSKGTNKIVENLGRVTALSVESDSLVIFAKDKIVYGFLPLLYVLDALAKSDLFSIGV